ncbi:hypothetical protein IQ22_02815 [Pseudomonas duriflava]|uniref:Uncharacterized protein n=1 Tax=Pseudomonas duriflava TaxID=459528 RepID=A0A562Q9Y8_9PSED|nr:hypothetical protein [Pseudomonas duriflava]TWI52980.1 hypothetical protein IQ22_02815 [Pseudomonas duriflava]
MADFYSDMATVALDLIGQYGQTVTLQRTAAGEYDPETGTVSDGTAEEQPASGVLLDYTGQEFLTNTQIQQGDKKLKIAAKGLEWTPEIANKVAIQGKAYSVINLNEINPAGTPLVYELQVRA